MATLIEEKKEIGSEEVCRIHVRSLGRDFEILVDGQFFREFFDDTARGEAFLVDRDKERKQLNDRLLIQRITGRLRWVCPVCLQRLLGGAQAGGQAGR